MNIFKSEWLSARFLFYAANQQKTAFILLTFAIHFILCIFGTLIKYYSGI